MLGPYTLDLYNRPPRPGLPRLFRRDTFDSERCRLMQTAGSNAVGSCGAELERSMGVGGGMSVGADDVGSLESLCVTLR